MQEELSDNSLSDSHLIKKNQQNLTPTSRMWMLIINFIPFFHLSSIIFIICYPFDSLLFHIVLIIFTIYFLPPLLCRLFFLFFPIQQGTIPSNSKNFLYWWASASLQAIFIRLSFLEELLRLIPGFYSIWLRLWGAKIGRITYWAPGMVILDRTFLNIGNDVIFGAGVRLNPHVLAYNKEGELELLLKNICIGDRAIIGGYALLTTGTEIDNDESLRAHQVSPPFTKWKAGERQKPSI